MRPDKARLISDLPQHVASPAVELQTVWSVGVHRQHHALIC